MSLKRRQDIYKKVEVNGNKELDYLEGGLSFMEIDSFDVDIFTVPSYLARRPDLISYAEYGDPDYGWLIMEYNDIFDPWDELYPGRTLKIPSLKQYYNFYNKNKRR